MNEAPSTSIDPTHLDILRTTKRTHQRVTRANKPHQHFLEEQAQKRQHITAKQQTTAVSHKTLNKLLQEQTKADAEAQAIEEQQRICSEGAQRPKTVGTNKNKPIPITQDNNDNETLASTEPGLPTKTTKPRHQNPEDPLVSTKSILYHKLQQAYPTRHYIPSQQTHSCKRYNGEWGLKLNLEQVPTA